MFFLLPAYFKDCRRILRYQCQEYFNSVPVLKLGLTMMSLFVKPLPDLPSSPRDRLLMGIQEGDYVLRSFLRFLGLFPEICSHTMSETFFELLKFNVDFTKEELNETVAKDFPGASDNFWKDDFPDKIFSPRVLDIYAERLKSIQYGADYFKNTHKDIAYVFKEFEKFLFQAMDFRHQAYMLESVHSNFRGYDYVYIPEINWVKSSKRILTYVRFQQEKFAVHYTTGHALAAALVKMILQDGLFMVFQPSDLAYKDDVLVLKATSCNVALSTAQRLALKAVVAGFLTQDYAAVAKAMKEAEFLKQSEDTKKYADFIQELLKQTESYSVAQRYGFFLEFLTKRGANFPLPIRFIYPALLSVETLCSDKSVWEEIADDLAVFLGLKKPQEPESETAEQAEPVLPIPSDTPAVTDTI